MRIYIRPVTLNDGSYIVKWKNSPKVLNHSFNKNKITVESNERFFKAYVETGKYKQFIAERIDEEIGVCSYPIATVYLKDIDENNHRCELCIYTSDGQEWNTESQSIAIKMLLDKAFNEYGMHKVYTHVFLSNTEEVELMKKSGLHAEGVLKEEAQDVYGNYVDIVRLAILDVEYKGIRDNDRLDE